jgi:type 1 glutamine amidotransferase
MRPAAVAFGLWLCASLAASAEEAGGKIRVLLTYGGHGFEEKAFFAMFDAMPGIATTKAKLPDQAGLLKPGLEKDQDVIVMYDMVGDFKPDQRAAFVELLKTSGIGLVALHHNLGAHKTWDEYPKIIGGKYVFKACEINGVSWPPSKYAHGQDMNIQVADKDHPITRGVADFVVHDETYKGYYVAPDVRVLLKTDHAKNEPSVAWVKEYGKSRVFYLMLGHDSKAWTQPAYPLLIQRGIRWAAGREAEGNQAK